MKEFRHVLLAQDGNHDFQLTKAHRNTLFGDAKYKREYQSFTCVKCGMGAIKYLSEHDTGLSSYYVVPVYPKQAVFNCPEKFGELDIPTGPLIAILGDTSKKKKGKKKKGKKKKDKKIIRTRNRLKKEVKRKRGRRGSGVSAYMDIRKK